MPKNLTKISHKEQEEEAKILRQEVVADTNLQHQQKGDENVNIAELQQNMVNIVSSETHENNNNNNNNNNNIAIKGCFKVATKTTTTAKSQTKTASSDNAVNTDVKEDNVKINEVQEETAALRQKDVQKSFIKQREQLKYEEQMIKQKQKQQHQEQHEKDVEMSDEQSSNVVDVNSNTCLNCSHSHLLSTTKKCACTTTENLLTNIEFPSLLTKAALKQYSNSEVGEEDEYLHVKKNDSDANSDKTIPAHPRQHRRQQQKRSVSSSGIYDEAASQRRRLYSPACHQRRGRSQSRCYNNSKSKCGMTTSKECLTTTNTTKNVENLLNFNLIITKSIMPITEKTTTTTKQTTANMSNCCQTKNLTNNVVDSTATNNHQSSSTSSTSALNVVVIDSSETTLNAKCATIIHDNNGNNRKYLPISMTDATLTAATTTSAIMHKKLTTNPFVVGKRHSGCVLKPLDCLQPAEQQQQQQLEFIVKRNSCKSLETNCEKAQDDHKQYISNMSNLTIPVTTTTTTKSELETTKSLQSGGNAVKSVQRCLVRLRKLQPAEMCKLTQEVANVTYKPKRTTITTTTETIEIDERLSEDEQLIQKLQNDKVNTTTVSHEHLSNDYVSGEQQKGTTFLKCVIKDNEQNVNKIPINVDEQQQQQEQQYCDLMFEGVDAESGVSIKNNNNMLEINDILLEDFDKRFVNSPSFDLSESNSCGYYENFSIKKSPWRTKAEMKANPILENTNTAQKQKPVEEQVEVEVINNENFTRVTLTDDRQLKTQSMNLTIEPIEGLNRMEPPKEMLKERVQVIESDIENNLKILTPFTTTSTSSMTQVKELCAATVATARQQDVSESEQSDKEEYVGNKEIMSTYEAEVKPVKLIIERKRIHEDASSKKKQQQQRKKQKTNKKVKNSKVIQQQHQEVLAIVGKQAEAHKLTKVVPNEIPNVNVSVNVKANAAYNTHYKERESGQVAFKGSCNEKSLLRNGMQCQYTDKYTDAVYESSALTPKQIDKMQQNTPSGGSGWTFEHNNNTTNFCQQIQQEEVEGSITEKSTMDEKLCISSRELLVRVPLSALTPDFQQRLEKTQQLGLELETKQEFTHGQAENEQVTKRQKMYVHYDDDDDDENNMEIDTSCLVDETDQSDFSSLFDGAFATTEINKAPPNTPASVSDFNNQDCSYFIHENTSMNYSPINNNTLDAYIENFPTNFQNNASNTSRKSLEREYEHDEHDLLTQLTVNASTLSGNCLSQQHQQNQQQQHSMLSPSHMSEMQDVETTLNCILNEMQDQHIYTPVSSHTDDFLNQSVYSPLTEPPITPNSSLFPESPADDTLSTASSPPQNYYQQQKQQLNHQQQLQLHASLPPAYMHDCFAEDSTQSELIGFQNNIPCFENIEQLSSPASMDSGMTKHQLQQQDQCLDIVHVKRKVVQQEENNNNKNCNNNNNNNQNDASLIEGYLNMNEVAKVNTNNNNNNVDSNNLRIVAELTTTTTKTTTAATIEKSTSNNELPTFLTPTISMEKIGNKITIDLEQKEDEEEEEEVVEEIREEKQKEEIVNVNVNLHVNDDDDEMKNYAVEYVQLLKEFEARQQEHEFMADKKCVQLVDEEEEQEEQLNEAKELIKTNTSAIITTTIEQQQPLQQTLTPTSTPTPTPQQQQQIIFSGQQPQHQHYQQSYHILQQQHQQQQHLPHYNVINLLQNTATGTATATSTPSTTLTLNNGCINLLTTPTTTLTAQELQWNEAGTTYYINTADLYRHHSHNQPMTSSTATAIEAGRGQASGIFDANALFALQQKQQQQQQQLLFLQQQQHQQQQTRQELQHYQYAQKLPERFMPQQQHALINPNENYMQRLHHYQQQEHQRLQQQQHQQQQVMILTIPHKAPEHHLQHQHQQQQHQSAQYETQDFTTTQTVYIQTPTQSTATGATVGAAATNLIGSGISTTNLLGLTLHESHNNSENIGVVVDEGAACTTLPLTLQRTSLQQQQQQQQQQPVEELKQNKAQKRKPQQKSKQTVTKVQNKKAQKQKQLQQPVKEEEKEATEIVVDKSNEKNNNNNNNNSNIEIVKLLCRFCYKRQKFTNNLDYSNHIIAMHPSETPYNCPYCPMHFTRRNKRQQHIVNQHDGQQFKCAACTEIFYSQRSLDIHLLRHHSKQRCLQQEQLLIQQEKLEQEQMQLQQAHVHNVKKQQQQQQQQRKVVHLEERVDRRQGRGRGGRGGGGGGGGSTKRGRGKGRTSGITRVADGTMTLDVWQTTDTSQTTTATIKANEQCK